MKKTSTSKKVLMTLNILLLVGLAGAGTYLFIENRDLNDQITLTTEEKNRRLIEEINQVYDLPDEEPVVAIVTDVDEFKETYPTFDSAQSGDYLLFYRKARLNVLYRQSENKVIKTATVVVPISVELVGSQDAIDDAQAALAEFGDQITVVTRVDDSITQAFVFDVDGDQAAEAQSIADQIGSQIGSTLPASIVPGAQTEIVIAVVGPVAPASTEAPASDN